MTPLLIIFDIRDVCGNDASFNNVWIKGDICGNDASFNNIDIRDICGNDASFNNIDIRDICGNDASFNNVDLNNLSITGVISAPNLTTLTIGQMKMGTNTYHTNMASFGNTTFENGQTNYAFGQASNGQTFMNATNNMYFRKNNTDRMILRDDGVYNTLELFAPNSVGSCKLRMKHGNGFWDIEAPTSECRWKYNGNDKMHISETGDLKVYRDILALGNISAIDASFNNIDIRDVCGNDASFNNIDIRDICGNDASFNNIDIRDICANDASFNNIDIRDICANDVSINNVVIRGDICGNDASFNNIDIRDICGNDASFNNLDIKDICGNDASFNNIDIRDICGNDASFNNIDINNLSVTGVFSIPNFNIVNLNTLVIGNALMGNSHHANYAVFCHKDLNTETDYALLQASGDNKTYLNCRQGGEINFRQNNTNRMILRDDGDFNTLEVIAPSLQDSISLGGLVGQSKIRMKHGNDYWDIEEHASEMIWRYNGEDEAMKITKDGDFKAYNNIEATNKIHGEIIETNNVRSKEILIREGTSTTKSIWKIYADVYGTAPHPRLQFHYTNHVNTGGLIAQIGADFASTGSKLLNFTGQHRTFIKDIPFTNSEQYKGLIVCSNQNINILMSGKIKKGKEAITQNETLPVCSLCKKEKDKSCFGVISSSEDPENRIEQYGTLTMYIKKEQGDTRIYINSVGEGAIWVINKNGKLEAGDYITTSDIHGYGMKQEDDLLHNYTVAKITMDCNFNPLYIPRQVILKEELIDLSGNTIINNILNKDNEIQWTDELDLSGNIIYEYEYNIRHLDVEGVIITKEEYDISGGYIAAYIGCTYHCG